MSGNVADEEDDIAIRSADLIEEPAPHAFGNCSTVGATTHQPQAKRAHLPVDEAELVPSARLVGAMETISETVRKDYQLPRALIEERLLRKQVLLRGQLRWCNIGYHELVDGGWPEGAN